MATNDKYDRQLRLWGTSGQKALSETCVILIRATAAGTETLKNLVLPGIGSYLIIDDDTQCCCCIESTEHQSNFFIVPTMNNSSTSNSSNDNSTSKHITGSCIPSSRAQMTCECIQELNPDVQGSWKHINQRQYKNDAIDDNNNNDNSDDESGYGLLGFDFTVLFQSLLNGTDGNSSICKNLIVIGSDLEPPLVEFVGTVCSKENIPLVCVFSYGLIGIVRIQTPALSLIDTKPRDSTPDLRIRYPFPALEQLYNTELGGDDADDDDEDDWNSTKFDNMQHGHIPYPFILLRALRQWKATHNGLVPSTLNEKQQFQTILKDSSRNFDTELNFQEAVRNSYLAYAPRSIDTDHVNTLLESTKDVLPKFYIMLQALNTFLSKRPQESCMYQPPLAGIIPDMTSSTALYVKLQNVYKEQAQRDWVEMKSYIGTDSIVTDDELTTFCQNVYNLDLLQTGLLQEEYSANNGSGSENTTAMVTDITNENNCNNHDEICENLAMTLMDGEDERMDQIPLLWYLGFRACQLFYKAHGRFPGVVIGDNNLSNSYENDIIPLQSFVQEIVQKYNLQDNDIITDTLVKITTDGDNGTKSYNYSSELVRFGNAEIHTIASIVGGVASQEAVKIITGQYIPINNTYVYNGIASIGGVYKF